MPVIATIGGFNFQTFQGRLYPAVLQNGLIEPAPGVTGYAVAQGAWRADPVQVTGIINVQTFSIADALRESYRSIMGTFVTVTDQFGKAWSNVLVMRVDCDYAATLFGQVRVESRWKLLVPSAPAAGAI